MINGRMADDQSRKNIINSQQDDSEDESEILEESPCGRWLKRREELEQRNIPGIDATFLAMDTEEGVEVVWNEVFLLNWDQKLAASREEKIKIALDQLIQLDHPNIVKLHKYWIDSKENRARVIFITEYMSSGSLKQFLKKTKRNVIKMALPAWKRWCTQLLSALCYMHSSLPPIIHGNLSCDSIFISHTGLIKIDAVAPGSIQRSLRIPSGCPGAGNPRLNQHFVAPEINYKEEVNSYFAPFPPPLNSQMDIYSFGICALEMAALEIPTEPSDAICHITPDAIQKTIESLENDFQKDFIKKCLNLLPSKRPTAKQLLFHKVLFEVPSLRLLSAHVIITTPSYQPEQLTEEALHKSLETKHPETVLAELRSGPDRVWCTLRCSDAPRKEVEKFLEEVRNGAYPLTALIPTYRPPVVSKHRNSPEFPESPETFDEESRRVIAVTCDLKRCPENSRCRGLSLNFRLDDKMHRQICCDLRPDESLTSLMDELVHFGLIHGDDRDTVKNAIDVQIKKSQEQKSVSSGGDSASDSVTANVSKNQMR